VNCVWYYKGSDSVLTKAHTHDCDEIIAFMGSNPDDPHDLSGETVNQGVLFLKNSSQK
jgi:hypothetical protein